VVLAEPIIRLLFERGKFDSHDTSRAAAALICLAPGLLAFSTVNILARAFYALGDLKTPMRISVFCLALNVVLVGLLIGRFREAGLGVANSATAFLNAALLLYALKRKLARLDLDHLPRQVLAMLGAGLAAAVTACLAWSYWNHHLGHATLACRLGEVFAPMAAATAVYLALASWLRIPYARELAQLLPKRLRS
jgi:putative peptidoglycan lipid II flippase